MKKILCPTDFSDAANDAVAYAAKLCHATGAALTLLHVQSLFDVTAVFQQKEKMLMLAKEELEAQSRQVAKTFKISCYAQVEQGIKRLSTHLRQMSVHGIYCYR